MESYVHSCHVLRTGRILQINSSNGMGFIDCPELKVVWLWRILECWNVDACCARQFLATTFMCTGIRRRKSKKNHAESESSIPRGGSVSHWHGSELCYFTEQGLGSFQLLQWYNSNTSRIDMDIYIYYIYIFRIFVQTVKANYKLTHSERPFCKVQIQSSSVRQTHRTWSRRPMICSPQAGLNGDWTAGKGLTILTTV